MRIMLLLGGCMIALGLFVGCCIVWTWSEMLPGDSFEYLIKDKLNKERALLQSIVVKMQKETIMSY